MTTNPAMRGQVAKAKRVPIQVQRARGRVHSQVKAGIMVKPDACSKCGNTPPRGKDGRSLLQGHHHAGYDRPTDIEWLCVYCHREETPCNPARGSAAAPAKLVESDIPKIRELAKEGMGRPEISRLYGVTTSCIRQVLLGLTWSHIP